MVCFVASKQSSAQLNYFLCRIFVIYIKGLRFVGLVCAWWLYSKIIEKCRCYKDQHPQPLRRYDHWCVQFLSWLWRPDFSDIGWSGVEQILTIYDEMLHHKAWSKHRSHAMFLWSNASTLSSGGLAHGRKILLFTCTRNWNSLFAMRCWFGVIGKYYWHVLYKCCIALHQTTLH